MAQTEMTKEEVDQLLFNLQNYLNKNKDKFCNNESGDYQICEDLAIWYIFRFNIALYKRQNAATVQRDFLTHRKLESIREREKSFICHLQPKIVKDILEWLQKYEIYNVHESLLVFKSYPKGKVLQKINSGDARVKNMLFDQNNTGKKDQGEKGRLIEQDEVPKKHFDNPKGPRIISSRNLKKPSVSESSETASDTPDASSKKAAKIPEQYADVCEDEIEEVEDDHEEEKIDQIKSDTFEMELDPMSEGEMQSLKKNYSSIQIKSEKKSEPISAEKIYKKTTLFAKSQLPIETEQKKEHQRYERLLKVQELPDPNTQEQLEDIQHLLQLDVKQVNKLEGQSGMLPDSSKLNEKPFELQKDLLIVRNVHSETRRVYANSEHQYANLLAEMIKEIEARSGLKKEELLEMLNSVSWDLEGFNAYFDERRAHLLPQYQWVDYEDEILRNFNSVTDSSLQVLIRYKTRERVENRLRFLRIDKQI